MCLQPGRWMHAQSDSPCTALAGSGIAVRRSHVKVGSDSFCVALWLVQIAPVDAINSTAEAGYMEFIDAAAPICVKPDTGVRIWYCRISRITVSTCDHVDRP